MWFPYSLPTNLKTEGDRQRANDSKLDECPRDFLVASQLRNPISNDWSVELQLAEPKAVNWKDECGNPIQVTFFPNGDNRLAEIVCKLSDTNLDSAIRRSYTIINKSLEYWSSLSGRGFSIAGIRVADLKHDARWRAMPHWPSALQIPLEIPQNIPDSFWPAAQLYTEGRTSSKDRYRFLCCYALICRWSRAEPPFDWQTMNADEASAQPTAVVDQEIMALSGAVQFAPGLEGLSIAELAKALESWHARALSFVSGDVNGKPDDFRSHQEWAAIANIADIAAHRILSQTLAHWQDTSASIEHDRREPSLA